MLIGYFQGLSHSVDFRLLSTATVTNHFSNQIRVSPALLSIETHTFESKDYPLCIITSYMANDDHTAAANAAVATMPSRQAAIRHEKTPEKMWPNAILIMLWYTDEPA